MFDHPIPLANIDPVVHIGSVALQLGPLAVRWYALAYLLGIGLGYAYALKLLAETRLWSPRRPPLSATEMEDLTLWLGLGVIVGGRLFYMLVYNLPETLRHPLSIFTPWNGGMSFHGGFLGVVIAGSWVAWRRKYSREQLLSVGDLLASVAPIGLCLGRLANFTNGELWGRPTGGNWGVIFCNDIIRSTYNGDCPAGLVPRHPSQLYEAGLEGVALLILAVILGRGLREYKRPGMVWGAFMTGYGISRIALENIRVPDSQFANVHFPFGLSMGMMLSIPMVIAGIVMMVMAWRKGMVADTEVGVEDVPQLSSVAVLEASALSQVDTTAQVARKPRRRKSPPGA